MGSGRMDDISNYEGGEMKIEYFVGAMVALMIWMIGCAIYQSHQRQLFLEQHGCQLVTKAATGRTVRVGKARDPEYVYVYECKDGDRTEIGE